MTDVQKVSIGGYAFTLEVEAYKIVKEYLDELNAHYAELEGGSEVMEGIEERMAELLYEKCADDGVASVAEVREILDILGRKRQRLNVPKRRNACSATRPTRCWAACAAAWRLISNATWC